LECLAASGKYNAAKEELVFKPNLKPARDVVKCDSGWLLAPRRGIQWLRDYGGGSAVFAIQIKLRRNEEGKNITVIEAAIQVPLGDY